MISLNRRDFLKLSSLVGGGLLFFRPSAKAGLYTPHYEKPKGEIKYYPNICSFCSTACDIKVRTRVDGKFKKPQKIDGNPNSTLNRGRICARGQSGIRTVYNPDRIKYPLIRVEGSKRGEWKFRKATWKEVEEYIRKKVQEHNIQPHEFAIFAGQRACAYERLGAFAFLASIGSPNMIGSPMQQCVMAEHAGANATVGTMTSHDEILVDMDNTKVMLVVGSNAALTGISVSRAVRFAQGKRNGMKVIVVDPRMSETASKADKWIPAKPGTNMPFLMAVLRLIIKNEWYEEEFLRRHTTAPFLVFDNNGTPEAFGQNANPEALPFAEKYYVYDEFSGEVVEVEGFTNDNIGNKKIKPALFAPKGLTFQGKPAKTAFDYLWEAVKDATPEWAAKLCDIPAKDIEETAEMLGTIKPANVYLGWMDGRYEDVVQARKAAAIINVLIGGVDRLGGWIYTPELREGMERFHKAYESGQLKNPMNLLMATAMAPGLLGMTGKLEGMMYSGKFPMFRGYPHFSRAYFDYRAKKEGKKGIPFSLFTNAGFQEAVEGKLTWNGKPYQIKFAYIYSTNPLKDYYGYKSWVKTFTNPNLKLVVVDEILPSDMAAFADVILPDKTYLEKYSSIMPDGPNSDMAIRMRFPSVSQIGDVKGGDEVFCILSNAIAGKRGGDYFSASMIISQFTGWDMKTVSKEYALAWRGKKPLYKANRDIALSEVSKKLGMTSKQLEKALEEKGVLILKKKEELMEEAGMPYKLPVPTFSGRVEIYSTLFAHFNHAYGVDPHWDPILKFIPFEYKKGAGLDYKPTGNEFFFAFGKVPEMTYLTTADNPLLHALVERHKEENYGFWMNPKSAARLGLKEGDKIEVENTVSGQKVKSFVHITEGIREDTVYVMSDFGFQNKKLTYASGKGVDLGRLIPYRLGPVTASAMSCQFTVKIRKI
ncbi:molybdopterin-dependent oxidoreductase [Hippea maritima]|uniref:Molybdopterin oxidoreductase n=1 Tax=Hippea maritima (strain ATCC 700847 / DSM 10411 / MH2) TaxID=760142 RepID=F2LU06_HIPMA|nr:molybdopterin-dependent oxidoreductase [Hippea maritima]AEA33405.1 molybdopterin oxidoreductase [Hippea maritima DSM 10411]